MNFAEEVIKTLLFGIDIKQCAYNMRMKDFFDVSAALSSATGITRFSVYHVAWLIAGAVICLLLCSVYSHLSTRGRAILRPTAAFLPLVVELLRTALFIAAGEYDIGRLPLHLCTMSVYLAAYHSLFGGELAGQLLYAFGMPGGICALVFPDWCAYPPASFLSASSFLLHIFLVSYPIMLAVGGDITPDFRRAPFMLGILFAVALPIFVFDRITGTNYMFLNSPAPGSPLEWFSPLGRPGYILGYIPLLLIVWCVIYAPFGLKKRR